MNDRALLEYLKLRGNELVAVRISAFCSAILSNNSEIKVGDIFEISDIFFPFLSDKHLSHGKNK